MIFSNAHIYIFIDSLEEQPDFTIMAEIEEDEVMEDSGAESKRLLASIRTLKYVPVNK